jgi:iron complex outermembrane receptor protein
MKKYFFLFCSYFSIVIAEPLLVPDSPMLLPEVLVSGKSRASLTVQDFKEKQRELSQRAGAVEVINADSYKTGRYSTLKDALQWAPGVYVQPRFGQNESRISIRGSGIQRGMCGGSGIQLLQDGMPINFADGTFNMQSIEPLATRYMEVYRGANSIEYGSTNLGGAINFVSFTGYDTPPFTARFEYGSFNTFKGQVSSGSILEKYDYYSSISTGFTDGYRVHSTQSNQRLFSNIGDKISEHLETRLYFTYVETRSQMPGGLTKSQMESNPKQANPINSANNWKKDYDFLRVADKTTWQEGVNKLEAQIYWNHVNFIHHAMSLFLQDVNDDLGFMLQWKNEEEIFEHQNKLTLGFNPSWGLNDNPLYLNNNGNAGKQIDHDEEIASNLNFFAQDQFYITKKLSSVVGTSVTNAIRHNRSLWNQSTNIDNSGIQNYWGYSPQWGLLYDATRESQFFGNISRSFSPPSFAELVNPSYQGIMPLAATTATTLEIGTRGGAGRYRWDLDYYYSWVENEIFPYSVNTLTGPSTLNTNAKKTVHQGVELGFDITLCDALFCSPIKKSDLLKEKKKYDFPENGSDRLYLKQVGLFNNFHFVKDPQYGNNSLPGIPLLFYRAELLYEHPCGFYAGPNIEWVPVGYNVDAAATLFTEPYAILGFKIGYRPKRGFSFYLEAMNLCNTTYAATTGVIANAQAPKAYVAQFFPGDGASIYGGIEYTF